VNLICSPYIMYLCHYWDKKYNSLSTRGICTSCVLKATSHRCNYSSLDWQTQTYRTAYHPKMYVDIYFSAPDTTFCFHHYWFVVSRNLCGIFWLVLLKTKRDIENLKMVQFQRLMLIWITVWIITFLHHFYHTSAHWCLILI